MARHKQKRKKDELIVGYEVAGAHDALFPLIGLMLTALFVPPVRMVLSFCTAAFLIQRNATKTRSSLSTVVLEVSREGCQITSARPVTTAAAYKSNPRRLIRQTARRIIASCRRQIDGNFISKL